MKKILLLLLSISHFVLMAQDTSNVSWPVDTSNSASPGEIVAPTGYKYDLHSVKDGSGGSFIVWSNYGWQDTSAQSVIYVQRLNAAGKAIWANPVKVAVSWKIQNNPKIVSDRAGGVIVAWNEYVQGQGNNEDTYNVFAQRINSNGALLWGSSGAVITNAPGYQYLWNLEEYGANSAVVSWDGSGSYFAILNANGQLTTPIQVHASHDSYVEEVFPQAGGGFSVVYYLESIAPGDTTEVYEAYFQKFDSNGQPQFSNGGVKFATGYENGPDIEIYDLISDGNGGIFYITALDDEDKMYLQHLTSNGVFAFGPNYGMLLSSSAIEGASLVKSSTGGVVVLWSKEVTSQVLSKGLAKTSAVTLPHGLFAQHISSTGTKLWGENGITVKSSGLSDQSDWNVLVDSNGNLLIVYEAVSNGGTSLYAQKVSPAGTLLWPANGVLVDGNATNKTDVSITLVDDKLVVLWGVNENMSGNTELFSNVVNPDGTTLPVFLAEFKAALVNSDVVLTWKTLTELNNNYFEVLRSDNGSSFVSIGKVEGKGTTSAINSYKFTDTKPSGSGRYVYYRLKQVDNNGAFSFSAVEKVSLPNIAASLTIFPNPVVDAINITSHPNASFSLRLSDINGKEVFKKVHHSGSAQFDISFLAPGTYIAELETGAEKISKKVVKL